MEPFNKNTQLAYGKARLWLGITNVGVMVLFAAFFITNLSLISVFYTQPASLNDTVFALLLWSLMIVAIQAPFDWIGGFFLPRRYEGKPVQLSVFFHHWLKAVLAYSSCSFLIGFFVYQGKIIDPFWGPFLCFSLTIIILTSLQFGLASILAPIKTLEVERFLPPSVPGRPVDIHWVETSELSFTGGISGWPGREIISMPVQWRKLFPETALFLMKLKRWGSIQSGARLNGLIVSVLYALVGFFVALTLTGGLVSIADFVLTVCWFTLWSFLGLLLLPYFNQQGVFYSDYWALKTLKQGPHQQEPETSVLQESIQAYTALQSDRTDRKGLLQAIFYPIPSEESRLNAIRKQSIAVPTDLPVLSTWHSARQFLYLSWAGLSMVNRSVHCNSGKPELWAFLPCD